MNNQLTDSVLFRIRFISICAFISFGFRQSTNAQTDSSDLKIKYQFVGDGSSIAVKPEWNNDRKMLRMMHSDEMEYVRYDEYFNRAVKRGRTVLVSGDKPRFALIYSAKSNQVDPDMYKMGDGRIRLTMNGKEIWLDCVPDINTTFNPSSTEYICHPTLFPGLAIRLLVSQAADWGAVARLSFSNSSGSPMQLKADLIYGGIRKCKRTFSASYFSPYEKEDISSNNVELGRESARLSDKNIEGDVLISSIPAVKPGQDTGHVFFSVPVTVRGGAEKQIYFILSLSLPQDPRFFQKIKEKNPSSLILESKKYYSDLLERYQISTPSDLLNNGFKSAVLNFDNIYTDPAWLEGIHWWSAYWTNNFQISAAIALQQDECAKKALSFFNSSQYGPAPVMTASGKSDAQSKNGEDGLPYYIFNLVRYYNSTGDRKLVLAVWPNLRKSIDLLWQIRDRDGDGLINWHMGANAFLYQADHLEMPGDAASPSLMMAGMLERLSVLGVQLGQSVDAERWHTRSEKIYRNLDSILWNNKAGAFYNHRDEQGLVHSAHYYSDLVFPTLYTSLPEIYGWQSLDYLYHSLWTNNYKNEKSLMRVGDFKPSIFGNDNVMPVQMAEAARAYLNTGENEKGIKLMESVALAATLFTEAPGNFPERMNDEGKGEANYLFGNPIASFIYTMISGVFGLELKDQGKAVRWQPSFPDKWEHASMKLPYAKVSYRKTSNTGRVQRVYEITQERARAVDFSLYLEPSESLEIHCNGKSILYHSSAALGKTAIRFRLAESTHDLVTVQYTVLSKPVAEMKKVRPGDALNWEIPGGIKKIMDPQSAVKNAVISGNRLSCIAGEDTGWHSVFVQSKELPVIYEFDFYNMPPAADENGDWIRTEDLPYEQMKPLDISAFYNSNRIFLSSRWRYEYASRDSEYLTAVNDTTKHVFATYGYRPKNPYTMAMIDNGISDIYTAETMNSGMPDQMDIPVNRKLQGLSFLWICETQSRNTALKVGSLWFNYEDGTTKEIPLVVGKNLDASWKYFATETEPVLLQGEDYSKIFSVHCDPGKELKSFKIVLIAADVEIGLMAVDMILPSRLPIVGAIRWDGWFYDTSNLVTQIVQKTLAPKEFHDRLPFFAKEVSNDSVYINGSAQEVMDQEIAYARAADLDYWAFVLYLPGEGLSLAMENYLKSAHRRDINFSIITEQGRINPANRVYLNYITRLLQEPGFQLVDGGRPLWYLGFIDSASVRKNWGSFRNMKNGLDSIRSVVMKSGRKNPYLVIMDFNASLGKKWSDSLGGDAISSYAANNNSTKAPYHKLTEQAEIFWNECLATHAQVIPILMAGWSPKPRLDYPNVWTHFYPKDSYYSNASAPEFGQHVRQGLQWLQKNQSSAAAQCVLIYAWNEYDEGGWICPTLYYGKDRLDELEKVLRDFKQKP